MADETSEASAQALLDFLAKQMAAASQKARRFASVAWPASGPGTCGGGFTRPGSTRWPRVNHLVGGGR